MSAPAPGRPKVGQFVVSCVVLSVGVGLLLRAALGSDGYSTLVNGIALSTGAPFVAVNAAVAAGFVAIAWGRGLRPRWATVAQPALVGATINAVLLAVPAQHNVLARVSLLVLAFPVVALGVAGYLGSGAGAGPFEAAALGFDPPVPFRWGYSVLQGTSALIGWLLGAAIGVGTLLVIFALGPATDLLARRVRRFDVHASARPPEPVVTPVTCEL